MKYFETFFFSVIIIFCCFACLPAQAPDTLWTRTYGGEHDELCNSIRETSDGGYIVAGWTSSFGAGGRDVYLLKIDEDGDTLWAKTYGGEYDDEGWSVQETSDGGFIVAGSSGSSYVYLIKTDSNGNLEWSEWYGGSNYDYGYSVQETSDSGYIIGGRISSFSAGGFDVFLVRADSKGNILWSKVFGGIGWDAGYSVRETSDNGYIIVGMTMSDVNDWDVYLVKTDENGDALWTKTYGGTGLDGGNSVKETSDGSYIIAGYTESFGAGDFDVYLIKTDSLGNKRWEKTYGGTNWDEGWSVYITSDFGYIITGRTFSFGSGGSDIFLVKVDPFGNMQWSKTYGGVYCDNGYSVQQTSDNGYIIAGNTKSFGSGLYDIYIIKTEPDAGVVEQKSTPKASYSLQIIPNPFSERIDIRLKIEDERLKMGDFSLKIYDLSGREVKNFSLHTTNSSRPAVISWDGRDNFGSEVSEGVYFLKFVAGKYIATKKLLMIK